MLEAEGADDLELTFIWETGEFTNDVSVMESVLEMMKAVGVRVKLQQFEPGGDISSWRQGKTGDWDVLGNGYGNQTGLALTTLQGMYAEPPRRKQLAIPITDTSFPRSPRKSKPHRANRIQPGVPRFSTPRSRTSGTHGPACGVLSPTRCSRNAHAFRMFH